MKILILSHIFDPEPNIKGVLFAKELQKLGHEVEVLTGYPNYPGGKLYPGYKIRFWQREVIDGIHITRVPLYPSHDNSAIKRIICYVSFALSAAIIGTAIVRKPDVVYVYSQPVTVTLPAIVLRVFRGIPFILDIQDIWPDTLQATGMFNSKLGLKMVGLWCRFSYRCASGITVQSPGFKQTLESRGVSEGKITTIYNWCDENHLQAVVDADKLSEELGLKGKFNIVFAGNMGKAQAMDAILDASALIAERYPEIQFALVGGGIDVDRLKSRAREESLNNVKFLERRPVSKISAILQLADGLLVHLKDDPLFRITIPGKTQAYLTTGKPIIMGVLGSAADLIQESRAGICCTPEDPVSIADAAVQLFSMPEEQRKTMGENGKKFYDQVLSLPIGMRKYDEVLQSTISEKH